MRKVVALYSPGNHALLKVLINAVLLFGSSHCAVVHYAMTQALWVQGNQSP